MIYIIPTKRGLGVEIWGTYDDLTNFYEIIGKFWNKEKIYNPNGFENRDKLISGFSYEIRKAMEGSRLKRTNSHYSLEKNEYLGCKISWVHFLFSITAIKFNMRYYETNKLDIAQILIIEFWLKKAMIHFDEIGANNLIDFIEDGLYGANNYIYQYMRSINLEYYLLGGGKKAFRKLPNLLKRGVYFTKEYDEYQKFLEKEGVRLNCEISELELNDNNIDYDLNIW